MWLCLTHLPICKWCEIWIKERWGTLDKLWCKEKPDSNITSCDDFRDYWPYRIWYQLLDKPLVSSSRTFFKEDWLREEDLSLHWAVPLGRCLWHKEENAELLAHLPWLLAVNCGYFSCSCWVYSCSQLASDSNLLGLPRGLDKKEQLSRNPPGL